MKGILEFNLPEDQHDFILATNAASYLIALENIRENVRQKWKYGEYSEETYQQIDEIYSMISAEISKVKYPND